MSPSYGFSRLLLLVLLVSAPEELMGQETPPKPEPGSEPASASAVEAPTAPIQQQQPKFFVRASADHKSCEYYEGEQLTLSVMSEKDAYLYVIYTQVDGETYVVFPNSAQPDNRVKAMQEVRIPGEKDSFRWKVTMPFGKEMIKVIAATERVSDLEKPEMRRKRLTRVTQKELGLVAKDLLTERPADKWAEVSLAITTHAGPNPNATPASKRFGVFIGVSKSDTTPLKVQAFGDDANKDLGPPTAIDAVMVEACMREIGKLDGTQVMVGPDATRAKFEQAVTRWLPSVSKPGDTVVIYYSGHGTQILDDNGDEADNLDELLMPCDTIDLDALIARNKLKQDNKPIDAGLDARLEAAWDLLARGGITTVNEQNYKLANSILMRATGVSDDLFGRWLQNLSGRKVIVVLDACRSGGFATQEKGLTKGDDDEQEPQRFDFLEGEAGRLKDLGQPDSAMLAACRRSENALNGRHNSGKPEDQEPASILLARLIEQAFKQQKPADVDPMGLMTFYLVNALLKSEGPLDVEQAGAQCTADLRAYFASPVFQEWLQKENDERLAKNEPVLEIKPHEPVFFDFCKPHALLKP